jgi:hypothetical protein
MPTLVLTNGEIVAATLAAVRPDATIVAWNDILHDGPVPAGLDAAALRAARAAHLAGYAAPGRDVLGELERRDAAVADSNAFDRVELWFEHDLADQLQLLQILDRLAGIGREEAVVHLPAPFHLGPLPASRLAALGESLVAVAPRSFAAAQAAFAAFRAPTPQALFEQAQVPLPGLPFASRALRRALEELPRPQDGLSRTELQILYSIGRGVEQVGPLFARVLAMEEAAFLGDLPFFRILSELAFARPPLVTGLPEPFSPAVIADGGRRKAFVGSRLKLTAAGRDVLAGQTDRVTLIGLDRWLGGTHLRAPDPWRFDSEAGALLGPR